MADRIQKIIGPRGTSYLVRVEYPPDPVTGKRRQRSKSFTIKKEAERQLTKWLHEDERDIAKRHPRPHRAQDRGQHRHTLLTRLLRLYADDSRFGKRLEPLWYQFIKTRPDLRAAFKATVTANSEGKVQFSDHVGWHHVVDDVQFADFDGGDIRIVRDYERAVRRFAGQWGLDRLPSDLGYRALHEWLCCWLCNSNHATTDFGRISSGLVAQDTPPDMIFTERGIALPVCVDLGPWRFRSERPAEAKARLYVEAERQINTEIDRLAVRLEAGGRFIFPQDHEELEKHLVWLYRRLAYRASVADITGKAYAERTVRQQTDRDRKTLGISSFPRSQRNYTP